MAYNKVVDSSKLDADMTTVADAIRSKGGTSEALAFPAGFVSAIEAIEAGGGGDGVIVEQATPTIKVDYNGKITATAIQEAGQVEAGVKTATYQMSTLGYTEYTPGVDDQYIPILRYIVGNQKIKGDANLVTENIKKGVSIFGVVGTYGGSGGGGGEVTPPTTPTDGKTRVYIHLEYGRTSPMLGVCPNGKVTVDWGDGTKPDTLTGTSTITVKWTPTHEYTAPGDYVIALTVEGTMGFYGSSSANYYSGILRYASGADARNQAYQNAVQKVEIGEGVTSIGNYAFCNCYSLASITIPESVTSIGDYAFQGCHSLASITIPESVEVIGDYAFCNCYSLASITIQDGVTSISGYAFYNCYSLTSITIPESVKSIGKNAFNNCYSLVSITIPEGVKSIGNYAFYNCYSLASITIPDGVTSIGNNAFQGCYSLASITIPESVKSISNYAFQGCYSLASITIPESVESISNYAFNNCYSLVSITIPEGVTSIGGYAFSYCYGMRYYDFTAHASVPALSSINAFSGISSDCQMLIPAALYDEWSAATNWATYAKCMVAV